MSHSKRFLFYLWLGLLLIAAGVSQASPGSAVQGAPTIALEPYIQGLNFPVVITNAGDGRLFVAEQGGIIRIIAANGSLISTPYVDISSLVMFAGEQGLLGLAFHPNYDSNGYFYVNYIGHDGDTHISRFTVTSDPNVADPNSEFPILDVAQPFSNHNGGDLHFGPDGYLYISLGDGGSGGDPLNNAQKLDNLLGKILRIDVDGASPYAIPHDNPFQHDNNPNTMGEIWVYGLRNPWRFSFDRLNGDMYIGDVGQGIQEEVNFQPAASPGGENYGWSCFEGSRLYNLSRCNFTFLPAVVGGNPAFAGQPSSIAALPVSNHWPYTGPIFDYPHYDGPTFLGCVVTGGYVYRGSDYPSLVGYYVFGDFCSGRFWLLQQNGNNWLASPQGILGNSPSALGQNTAGELFVAGYGGNAGEGTIHKVTVP